MKKLTKILVAGALSSAALSAYATPVLSYSVTTDKILNLESKPGSVLDITGFDLSKGVLQSVQVDLYTVFSASLGVENKSLRAATVDLGASELVTLNAGLAANVLSASYQSGTAFNLARFDRTVDYAGTSGASYSVAPVTYKDSAVYADALTLAAFGAHSVSSAITGVTGASFKGNGTFDQQALTNIDAYAVVTYNYTTAVPEPETYAMLLAGLGLMGVVLRKRKAA